ncbi:MAG TPA: hypothetical protein DDW50_15590 [Firmicutes bacterium]|nr:hypothetical protein [Bacillota bacterium]
MVPHYSRDYPALVTGTFFFMFHMKQIKQSSKNNFIGIVLTLFKVFCDAFNHFQGVAAQLHPKKK